MAKPKLKVVEITLEAELEIATAAAEKARSELATAESAFENTYGDPRFFRDGSGPNEGTLDSRQPEHIRAERRREKSAQFREANEALASLRIAADLAGRHVRILQTTIEERVSETGARAELAATLETIAKAAKEVERLDVLVDTFDKLVERARAAVAAANLHLVEATVAVDTAMSAGLSDFLREDGSVPGAGVHDGLRASRNRRIEAADELEMAQNALGLAERRLSLEQERARSAIDALSAMRSNAQELARQIAATAVPRLIEEAEALQLQLEGRRNVLKLLAMSASSEHHDRAWEYLQRVVFPYGLNAEEIEDHPAAAPWLLAIDNLTRDSGAPLPE